MKIFRFTLAVFALVASAYLAFETISDARINQKQKQEYAELNSIKYGLLSVEAWVGQLRVIIISEVNKFNVTNQSEKQLRKHIAVILDKMIDEAAAKVAKSNNQTTMGKFKQAFIETFVDINDIKKGIPEYTTAVIDEIKNPKTKKQLKAVVRNQLDEIASKTSDPKELSKLEDIISRRGGEDAVTTRKNLNAAIDARQQKIVLQSLLLVALAVAGFTIWTLSPKDEAVPFMCAIGSLVMVLATGVATPMIDLDAGISQFKFTLMNHPIVFENQVLYFQSKSIWDVFWLMITDVKIQMKLVGVLVVTFSLVFPVAKLLSMAAYNFRWWNLHRSRIVNFFVHQSGKWSMADVLVVAIFMSYIGFNGVISSQLGNLAMPDSGVNVIATNGTSLQPGFFVFLGFVLLSLGFSLRLSKVSDASPAISGKN